MPLVSFNINNFRNLSQAELDFNYKCNIFYGKNGSGKTSFLEAIYYLILGRSFRSHLPRRIIKYGEDGFSLFGKILQTDNLITAGTSRSIATGKTVKIAGKNIGSNIEITKLLPLQLSNHDNYTLFYSGSKTRRQFIDWGLFHVEQSFLDLWRKMERIIEQRNSVIRTQAPIDHIKVWNKDLSKFGLKLHNYRKQYVESLVPVVKDILQKLLCDFPVDISYFAGWDTNLDLDTVLENNLKNDFKLGYTVEGPHRADLQISVGKVPVKDALSRGQQKLLLYGLQIAQGTLLNKLTNKEWIYLVDDLLAELDLAKCQLLADTLLNLPKTQLFVTGLGRKELENLFTTNEKEKKMVQLNNGEVIC